MLRVPAPDRERIRCVAEAAEARRAEPFRPMRPPLRKHDVARQRHACSPPGADRPRRRFVADLSAHRYLDRIEDMSSGAQRVNRTPTFFVNGIRHGPHDALSLIAALQRTARRRHVTDRFGSDARSWPQQPFGLGKERDNLWRSRPRRAHSSRRGNESAPGRWALDGALPDSIHRDHDGLSAWLLREFSGTLVIAEVPRTHRWRSRSTPSASTRVTRPRPAPPHPTSST